MVEPQQVPYLIDLYLEVALSLYDYNHNYTNYGNLKITFTYYFFSFTPQFILFTRNIKKT